MNDYKELLEDLRTYACFSASSCGYYAMKAADAIEQLAMDINVLTKERDAAIAELRKEADNCKWCKWWKPYANFKYHCTCPNSCCVDGNPDRWEWRGVQE